MHELQLPFGARMSERLFRIVEERHHGLANGTDCAWSLVWGSRNSVFRSDSWVLTTIPKAKAEPDRLFTVAGIPFYISYEVEALVTDQIFDWDDKEGVVSHAA
jgi:hypothetical protein